MKKVNDTTRFLSGQKAVQSKRATKKNGLVMTMAEYQLSRWKGHFQDVLNRPAPENPPDLTEEPLLGIQTGQINMVEVKRSLKSTKSGEVVGCDNVLHKPRRREDWFRPRYSTPS